MGFGCRRRLRELLRAPCERIGDCALDITSTVRHRWFKFHCGMPFVCKRVCQRRSLSEAGCSDVEVGALGGVFWLRLKLDLSTLVSGDRVL